MKVLLIEDERHAAENLARLLKGLEPNVELVAAFAKVKEAVEFLERNSPDLIFMDVNLSDGNCSRIFEQVEVKTPVIFTTAYGKGEFIELEKRAFDWLQKPISRDDLKRALDKYKGNKELAGSPKTWTNSPEAYEKKSSLIKRFYKAIRVKKNS
jgi:two-component SAPR family response regulator